MRKPPAREAAARRPSRAARPAPRPNSAFASLQNLATLGSPVALAAALLFYFGWRRTDAQGDELGFDASILDLASQDYVLKSVNVLYVPVLLLLLSAVLAYWLHERLVRAGELRPAVQGRILRLARVAQVSWAWWLLLAVVLTLLSSTRRWGLPVVLTVAVAAALYGAALERRVTNWDRGHAVQRGLLWAVLVLVLFWDVERLALVAGEGYARTIARGCSSLTAVVSLYSGRELTLELEGVRRIALDVSEDARYRFRYDWLLLVQRTRSGYIFINRTENDQTRRVTVLERSEDLRLEFLQRPWTCPS
jgi:hypothetical protein